MGQLETMLLITAIKWLIRWLSSNEKNREAKIESKKKEDEKK